MSPVQQIEVAALDADQRLDRWFKAKFPHVAHGRLEKLLRTGQIRLDGKRVKASERVQAGQVVRVPPLDQFYAQDALARGAPAAEIKAPHRAPDALIRKWVPRLKSAVLHRDEDVLIIDKPAGLAVQGGSGLDVSLDALLDHLRFGASERPRLVHRLDRDTTGVLVLARNAGAARKLTLAFKHKDVRKIYWALVVGMPALNRGKIDAPLAKMGGVGRERMETSEEGDRARTYYVVLDHAGAKASALALMPITGRTHQIRAHCALLDTPILGDRKYGGPKSALAGGIPNAALQLHARRLRLPHPGGGWLDVEAPMPDHMRQACAFLGLEFAGGDEAFADVEA